MAHLRMGRVNVEILKEEAQRDLIQCLKKYDGTKTIVWDDKLMGPFGLLADYPFLKQNGVTQMVQLRIGKLPAITSDNVIYLIRAELSLMNIIADNIFSDEKERKKDKQKAYKFHILFMPRGSLICQKKLGDLGVAGSISSISEYQVEMYPVDTDVISMELPNAYKDIYIDNDKTSLFHVATALMKLQAIFGIIPNVYGQGKAAKHVTDLITRMRRELGDKGPQLSPKFDSLLLLDRSVDLITPLVTQRTYEGLIDEFFGINHNHVKLPPEKFAENDAGEGSSSSEPLTESKQFTLNSSEEVFAECRDKHFNALGATLKQKFQELNAVKEENTKIKTVAEMKELMTKVPIFQKQKKSAANHVTIGQILKERMNEGFYEKVGIEHELLNGIDTDPINPYIEDCIAREEELTKVLRLICLQSLTNGGLKPKTLEYYKREILQTYGYQHILTLQYLEKCGLLSAAVVPASFLSMGVVIGKSNYNTTRKTLRLNVEKFNEQNPVDISYVYHGYAPASVRLAQFVIKPGWRAITDLLRILPEPTVEEVQQIPNSIRQRRNSGTSQSIQSGGEEHKQMLIFFLGGCTFAEISALRYLSQQPDMNVSFTIATTKIINGKTFIESLSETLMPKEI